MPKQVIIGLVIVLFFLIIILSYFTRTRPSTDINPTTVQITGFQISQKDRFNKLKPLTNQQKDIEAELIKQTPYETEDFLLTYSGTNNKFFAQMKTAKGQSKYEQWVKNNNLQNILNSENTSIEPFNTRHPGTFQKQAEKIYSNYKADQLLIKSLYIQSSNEDNEATMNSLLQTEIQVLKVLDALLTLPKSEPLNLKGLEGIEPGQTSPVPEPTIYKKSGPLQLSLLFEEVGEKVGVPPKLLESFMYIESQSTFSLTPQQVGEYSTPGNSNPSCKPNVCSATGPMQMTIGQDADGSNLCPKCCWKGSCLDQKGGCPNAWASYGNAVQSYGGYTHQSNPCNLRDNLYAAAAKIKRDSGTSTTQNWSKEEVHQAAVRYFGNCTAKVRNNMTYCENIWALYQQN